MEQIPVYAFTGFLDSGKTKFIQETLEDPRFNAGERTLVLIFEEGGRSMTSPPTPTRMYTWKHWTSRQSPPSS